MPRAARKKYDNAIYHIMGRSISEVDLFREDADKSRYFSILKEYQIIYEFKVYAYCLMDNHFHLIIDGNGADISKIMHSINFKYAQYFNRKYKRHGHLFQDRFKSKIIESERYLVALSAYIHNNPMNIFGYENRLEHYYFSSLAVYLGLKKDPFGILDNDFILGLLGDKIKKARKIYANLVVQSKNIIDNDEGEFEGESTDYKSGRHILTRNFNIQDAIDFIVSKMEIEEVKIRIKNCRESVEARALLVIILRGVCNVNCKSISKILGNITQSRISELSSLGIKLIGSNSRHKGIVKEFIQSYA